MRTLAAPTLVFRAEMDLACTYAMRRPALARECALHALSAAQMMGRVDLAYQANELLGCL